MQKQTEQQLPFQNLIDRDAIVKRAEMNRVSGRRV